MDVALAVVVWQYLPMKSKRLWVLFLLSFAVYLLTARGALRSPDEEIQYLSSRNLVDRGALALAQPMDAWPEFGLARGRAEEMYPVFGPLQPILSAPLVYFGTLIAPTIEAHWLWPLPLSHYVRSTLRLLTWNTRPETFPPVAAQALGADAASARELLPHAERLLPALLFNPLCAALAVAAFYAALRNSGASTHAAVPTSTLLAFGTLLWPYSGTFFSEPLATAFVTLSFAALLSKSQHASPLSGLFLGLAVAAHITAILFAPFFAAYLLFTTADIGNTEKNFKRDKKSSSIGISHLPSSSSPLCALCVLCGKNPLLFLIGIAPPLLALALWNWWRFGSPLETGRYIDPQLAHQLGYGFWRAPTDSLAALLVLPAKGLLFTCPAVLIGIWGWCRLRRIDAPLAWMILSAAAFRILFIASRTDWHGGFSLGPRYLVMLLPLLLFPAALLFEPLPTQRWKRALPWMLLVACVLLQWAFVLGNPLLAMYRAIWLDDFAGDGDAWDELYSTWFPLTYYWPPPIQIPGAAAVQWTHAWGPFWLEGASLSPLLVWLFGLLPISACFALCLLRSRKTRSETHSATHHHLQ